MNTLNIAVVGAGMIADTHIAAIRADGRAHVSWIAARFQETLDRKMSHHAIPKGTCDYREILDDRSVDAIIIATPPFLHKEIACAALDAGKHILLEKPMAVTPEQVRTLCDMSHAHPECIVLECSCRHSRLQPKYELVKRCIDDGLLGKIYHIHHTHLMQSTFAEYNPKALWALESAHSGSSPLMDWGEYDLSFHLGLLSDIPVLYNVRSFTRESRKLVEHGMANNHTGSHRAAYMTFDTGLSYYYECGAGVHLPPINETRIYGTDGCLRFGYCSWDPAFIECVFFDEHHKKKSETIPLDVSYHPGDHEMLMSHFLDCILKGDKPAMNVDLAARHLEIIFRM